VTEMNVSRLVLISGSDHYAIRREASKRLTALCGEPPEHNPKLEIIHGDGGDGENKKNPEQCLDMVVESINTPPFLDPNKVIWLKRLDFSKVAKTKSAERLVAAIKAGIPEDITLVMDGTGMDRRSALFKTCQKHGEIVFLEKINVSDREWEKNVRVSVLEACRARGVNIAPDAAAFVAETCGADSGRAVSEIDKLAAYAAPRAAITLDDCKAVCSATPEAAAWAFSDALTKRNLRGALDALDILYDKADRHIGMLITVSNAFLNMISIRVDGERLAIPRDAQYARFKSALEGARPEIKERMRGNPIFSSHPYKAWMLFSCAARFDEAKLARALTSVLEANKQMVSGGCDERIILETLTSQICGTA